MAPRGLRPRLLRAPRLPAPGAVDRLVSMPSSRFTFRPLSEDDLPLLQEWLGRPHLQEWWRKGEMSLEAVRKKYLPRIVGAGAARPFWEGEKNTAVRPPAGVLSRRSTCCSGGWRSPGMDVVLGTGHRTAARGVRHHCRLPRLVPCRHGNDEDLSAVVARGFRRGAGRRTGSRHDERGRARARPPRSRPPSGVSGKPAGPRQAATGGRRGRDDSSRPRRRRTIGFRE